MPIPIYLSEGRIAIRLISLRNATRLKQLLLENRGWLEEWEATYPGFVRPLTPAFSMRPVVKSLLDSYKRGTGLPFVIEYDGTVVGQVSVSTIVRGSLSSAQIGYWIAEEYAGRGITPVAVMLATDYAMRVGGLHRIEICIRPENAASLRVVEKLGFRYEGRRANYIHINNRWCDHDCFALTVEDIPDGLRARYIGETARRH